MTLCLIFDRLRWEEKALAEKAKVKGIDLNFTDAKDLKLDSDANRSQLSRTLGSVVLQRCISYFRGLHLTAFLESKGIDVINPLSVAQICGNKLLTTLSLERKRVPTPRTVVSFTPEMALQSMRDLGFPIVMKPLVGSWGRMVTLVDDERVASALLEMKEELSHPLDQIYYVQEEVKRPPRDIRCVVVGDKVVAAEYRHSAPGEWRTNVARGGRVEAYHLTKELESIVLRAAEAVGGGVLGVDVLEGKDGFVVVEVNHTVEFRGAASVSEADIPEAIIDYARDRMRR